MARNCGAWDAMEFARRDFATATGGLPALPGQKKRPIVVVVTIEKGGFGAETAAPVARLILNQWFSTGDTQFHAGTSTTL